MGLDGQKFEHVWREGRDTPLIALISNPQSTTNKKKLPVIRKFVEASHSIVHFIMSDIESISGALELFNKAKPDIIIINGGDGTVGAVLAAIFYRDLLDFEPVIAILPGGKTNMTAADYGAAGAPEKILDRIIQMGNSGELLHCIERRNLIELDLGNGSEPKVGTFFGAAGIVKGIGWCRKHAYSKGLPMGVAHFWSFLKLTTAALGLSRDKTLMESGPMSMRVKGGGVFNGNYAVVLATTLDKLLFGMKPYGVEGVGGLRFSSIEPGGSNVLRAMRTIITGSFGREELDGIHTRRSNEISIEGPDPITLDGEIYKPTPGVPMKLKGDRSLPFVILRH